MHATRSRLRRCRPMSNGPVTSIRGRGTSERVFLMKLYTYFRSSAAFRVRIALNLKQLEYQSAFVNLPEAEQRKAEYLAINPQGLVPLLEDGASRLTQSLAIIEYLDETFPKPP